MSILSCKYFTTFLKHRVFNKTEQLKNMPEGIRWNKHILSTPTTNQQSLRQRSQRVNPVSVVLRLQQSVHIAQNSCRFVRVRGARCFSSEAFTVSIVYPEAQLSNSNLNNTYCFILQQKNVIVSFHWVSRWGLVKRLYLYELWGGKHMTVSIREMEKACFEQKLLFSPIRS